MPSQSCFRGCIFDGQAKRYPTIAQLGWEIVAMRKARDMIVDRRHDQDEVFHAATSGLYADDILLRNADKLGKRAAG
ncbi:hypothetical protein A0U87_16915 [Sphingobium sp. MP9-4]|nr:hypothetical protein A0U87_16915 [Sphingobium sp. MP9-4]